MGEDPWRQQRGPATPHPSKNKPSPADPSIELPPGPPPLRRDRAKASFRSLCRLERQKPRRCGHVRIGDFLLDAGPFPSVISPPLALGPRRAKPLAVRPDISSAARPNAVPITWKGSSWASIPTGRRDVWVGREATAVGRHRPTQHAPVCHSACPRSDAGDERKRHPWGPHPNTDACAMDRRGTVRVRAPSRTLGL